MENKNENMLIKKENLTRKRVQTRTRMSNPCSWE